MQGGRVIVFAPSDPQVVYAGFGAFYSAGTFDNNFPASGVYVSNNGGSSWTSANDGSTATANVSGLEVHPSDPQMVYMVAPASGLFKTMDGGRNWTKIGGLPGGVRSLSVALDPVNPDLILLGSEGRGFFRSEDSGQTWNQVYSGIPAEAVITTILFHPIIPGVVFCGDALSGVYRSMDSGQTWQTMSNGLRTRAANALVISADGLHLYVATEGEGVFRLDLNNQPPDAGVSLVSNATLGTESPSDQPEKEPGKLPVADELQPEEQPDEDAVEFEPPVLSRVLVLAGGLILIVAVILIVILNKRDS
jgi:photosystem II stability/assembly factor-like uncharacterized protein